MIWANEEAEVKSLPPNYYASRIMQKLGYDLLNFLFCTPRGTLVLVGLTAEDKEIGLSKSLLKQLKAIHTEVLQEDREEDTHERDASPVRQDSA